jgi:hypothetical protein
MYNTIKYLYARIEQNAKHDFNVALGAVWNMANANVADDESCMQELSLSVRLCHVLYITLSLLA